MTSQTMTPLTRRSVLNKLRSQPTFFDRFSIKRLAIFGSVARDQATPTSDLDVLVDFREDITLNLYMSLKFFLEDLFGVTVDLVIMSDLKVAIRDQVLREAIDVTPS
jgi:predicted nucleotidyltransferase